MESNLINIIPTGKTKVYHASQNDNGRTIRLELTEALTGTESLTIRFLKLNGDFGSFPVASVSGTSVDADIPSSLTDIAGYVYCKLRINGIGAKAFYIEVERRP